VTREDFRRELGDAFDSISGSPSPDLSDRVRSGLVQAPEQRGPVWIAALAAAVITVIVVGVLMVGNPLYRPPLTGHGPGIPSPSQSPATSAAPNPSPTISPAAGPFICGASSAFTGKQAPPSAFIDAVRTGTHTGYDRVTIEFKNGQAQTIELRPQTGTAFTRDGIGDTVKLAGTDGLLVSIFSADAHTSYSGSRDIKTGYSGLLEVRLVGDYEGYVHFGLGLSKPACYRSSILTNPTRLVIDIQVS
jgi:hypothetical protein